MLFLVPLALALFLMGRRDTGYRYAIGALFSFIYALPLTLIGHVLAIRYGLWTFDSSTLALLGFPADIWFAGAFLWGPVLFLLLPEVNPWLLVLPAVVLNGIVMPMLSPFLIVGEHYFAGVVVVFLAAHLPALYLARWTARNVQLPYRAALLAVAHGGIAYFVLPTIIMHAMGGSWAALALQPDWVLTLLGALLVLASILGLHAVQMFVVYGNGTPIPLDPTQRLVYSGLYAYVRNPMQLSTALAWLVIGIALRNVWVALAALMAVAFVLGLVRWHHRHDLERRFPDGWPALCANVPEWLPRWRPWVVASSSLTYDALNPRHAAIVRLLGNMRVHGLELNAGGGALTYKDPDGLETWTGASALAASLWHVNFAMAFVGASLMLLVLPFRWARGLVRSPEVVP